MYEKMGPFFPLPSRLDKGRKRWRRMVRAKGGERKHLDLRLSFCRTCGCCTGVVGDDDGVLYNHSCGAHVFVRVVVHVVLIYR